MSVCNLKNNVIFIHVPKTAGSSMEHASFIGGGGHSDIRYFKRAFRFSFRYLPAWDDMFKFGFVRNPYDRLASAFTANFAIDSKQYSGEYAKYNYKCTKEDFRKFVANEEQNLRDGVWIHARHQYKFLCIFPAPNDIGKDENPEVDFVGRFENIYEDWTKACKIIGEDSDLRILRYWGKNEFTDYDSLYTPRTRELVADIYKKDFEIFDYAF